MATVINDHTGAGCRFLQIHLGGDRNFSYLLGDEKTRHGIAIDPGFAPADLARIARERELDLRQILITHGHPDHAGGASELARLTGATIHAGVLARVPGALALEEGEVFHLGEKRILSFYTPGHAPGHFCFLFEGRLVTGDLLFCGKVGGTGPHFPGSSAQAEWDSLRRIMTLPDETLVFPGHDYYGGDGSRPHSTIGHERAHNPFLLCDDFEAFCTLKENWAEYKREHGIR
jgi:glyoxylase-like metal-dependent hydrolase (beta-lactamase superfamily II)